MSHLGSNITSKILSGSIFSEILRIARCTLRFYNFIPRASDLFSRMVVQCGNRATLAKEPKKVFHRYSTAFQKFGKIHGK